MLEINNLSIKVEDRYLIKNLNLVLNKGDKLAIIGEEGNGKSSLLKSIIGESEYLETEGTINYKNNKIGYLEQSIDEKYLNSEVYNYLFKNETDYFDKINNLYKYLEMFNLDDELLHQTIKYLSGGEKIKIGLLKLLLEENDILLLDEPTNDLDIDSLKWLEEFIANTNKPIMYVSHDETLLSKTANIILHIEQIKKKTECRHTLIKINYDEYVKQRLNKIDKETKQANFEKREFKKKQEKLMTVMEKVEYRQNTITRADPHGGKLLKKKMHSLKSQEKKLNNLELTEIPDVEEGINFFFEKVFIPNNKIILKLDIKELKVSNKVLSRNINLEVKGPEHICIIGKNGVGKTTLIREIKEALKNRTDIKVGYMPQNYDEILSNYDNVLEYIVEGNNKEEITKARMYLGNMKFTKEEMTGKIKDLSNGTKAKLILMKLVLDKCSVLILDEPTRNVSPLSNPVIRKVLKEFEGTIISISHDRKYILEVCNNLYELTKEGLNKIKEIN